MTTLHTANATQLSDAEVTAAIQESVNLLLDPCGISALPAEEQRSAIEKISDLLVSEMLARAIDRMDDERAKAFADFIETEPTQEAVLKRLMNEDPLFIQSIDEVAQEFIEESDYVMGFTE